MSESKSQRSASSRPKRLPKNIEHKDDEDELSGIRERYATIADVPYSLGHGFELKQSQIVGAGNGVWTTMPIPKNVIISSYYGRLLTQSEADALPKSHMPYTIALGKEKKSWVIDGSNAPETDGSPFGTQINDPRNGKLYNVQFTLGPDKKSVNVRTIRKLLPGEELYVNYRSNYWKTWTALFHRHPLVLSERNVPAYLAREKRSKETQPSALSMQKRVPRLEIKKSSTSTGTAPNRQKSDDDDDANDEYRPKPKAIERKKTVIYKYSLGHGFERKKSQIPGAGKGIWTTKPFRKGQTLSYYSGKLIDWKETERLEKKGGLESSYLIKLNDSSTSDALNGFGTPDSDGSPFGQYINDPVTLSFVNCEYVMDSESNTVEVMATRDLVKGEELFLSYGKNYWTGFEKETGKKPSQLKRVILADTELTHKMDIAKMYENDEENDSD